MTTDPRIRILAREFCEGHVSRSADGGFLGTWPCNRCLSHARSALAALDGNPTLFPVAPTNVDLAAITADAGAVLPLTDPTVNTPGLAPRGARDTTSAARLAVMPRTGTQRRRILELFRRDFSDNGRFTDDEIADALRMSPNSVRPRRGELVAGGWLRDSGLRRSTPLGNEAIVWEQTDRARSALILCGAAS